MTDVPSNQTKLNEIFFNVENDPLDSVVMQTKFGNSTSKPSC